MPEEFEVCISYARKNVEYVSAVVAALEKANVRVFFDRNYEATLWGTNLRRKLAFIYQNAKFCVVFLSAAYQESVWTQYELAHAGMRALHEDSLLPVRLDDTEPPLELSHLVWIEVGERTPETIAELIVAKVKGEEVRPRKRTRSQKIKDYVRYRVWRIGAVLALIVALAALAIYQHRPSRTMVRFDHATQNFIVLRVENSGAFPSQLTGYRLKFQDVPLENTELRMLRTERRSVEPGEVGLRNLLPSELELIPTLQFVEKQEIERRLAAGVVTLEVDVTESDEASPRTRPERMPANEIGPFIRKWVPDVP